MFDTSVADSETRLHPTPSSCLDSRQESIFQMRPHKASMLSHHSDLKPHQDHKRSLLAGLMYLFSEDTCTTHASAPQARRLLILASRNLYKPNGPASTQALRAAPFIRNQAVLTASLVRILLCSILCVKYYSVLSVFKYLLSLPRKWRKIKPRTVGKSMGHRETGLTLNSKALGQSPHQTQRMGKKFSQTTSRATQEKHTLGSPPETKVVMPQLLW